MIEIVKLYSEEDSYNRKQYFVSVKNILNVLSRLVVFIEDINIIIFLEILSRYSQKKDSFIIRDIKKILQNNLNYDLMEILRMLVRILFSLSLMHNII